MFLLALIAATVAGCGAASTEPCGPASPHGQSAAGSASEQRPDDLSELSDEDLVRKLMSVTGGAKIGKQIADTMLDNFAKTPDLPPGFVEQFKKKLRAEDFIEMVVPIYLEHYDRQTMIAAIHFYESEPGKVLVGQLPAITAASGEAGRKWGERLVRETFEELGIPVKGP